MDNKKPYTINNFGGGYCGNLPPSELATNQAADLDNIVVKVGGLGFRARNGTSKAHASSLGSSGGDIQGLGYLRLSSNDNQYIVAIADNGANAKFYTSSYTAGSLLSFSDSTGAYAGITGGFRNRWSLFGFNDTLLGFGGGINAPDAPIKWTGAGNVVALGGTAPSAYGGFSANNRVFAFRTAANPSTIYWSSIASSNDFAGAGSGSAVVGSFGDNQKITAAAVLSVNYALVFRENSVSQMVITTAPFPVYTLFDSVGCVGKNAVVVIDGTAYFITSRRRMVSTDGQTLTEYPGYADDLWNTVTPDPVTGLYDNIVGFRQRGADYDWLVWLVYLGGDGVNTGPRKAIIWDLKNKCWLTCSTGYKMQAVTRTVSDQVFLGGSLSDSISGSNPTGNFIYTPDTTAATTDEKTSGSTNVVPFWRSGWLNPAQMDEIVQVQKLTATYATGSGNLTVNYGFDFVADSKSLTLSLTATGSETYTSRQSLLTGRGNFFQFKIGQAASTGVSVVNLTLRGKSYGQKKISAS